LEKDGAINVLTDIQLQVIAAAEAETGEKGLTLETKVAAIFKDSLEYFEFLVQFNVPNDAIEKIETLGDLANAVVPD
jgi:hypothetical protein